MTKKFFAGLLFVCILSCSAYANLVYITDNGTMGLIEISETLSSDAPVEQYSGIADDSIALHYYNEDGSAFVALIEPETDINNSSGDKAYIFNISDLTQPVNDEAKILTGVYGTNSAAYSDNHKAVFFASGINGEAKISQFDTGSFNFVRSFSYISSNDNAVMNTVLVDGSSVFGLANQATSQDSLFFRFDGQLNNNVQGAWKTKANYNSELIAFGSNNRVFLAHSGGVDQLNNSESRLIVSTDTPVKALCRDKDSGFYFITQSDDSGIQVLRHYKNESTITEVDNGASESLICQAVYHDKDNKKFIAAIIDDGIVIYDPDDDSIAGEFTSSDLGGIPTFITGITQQSTSVAKSSNSHGCNITGAGILLTLSAYILIRRRKG